MVTLRHDVKCRDDGFTLIELLIVVAIIAILAAIAIPQFFTYRERAARATMVSDARNAKIQEEAYSVGLLTYTVLPATVGPTVVTVGSSDFVVSQNNTMTIAAGGTGSITNSYSITIANTGSGTAYGNYSVDNLGVCSWSGGASC